ncbi:MAG: hypothetical protein H7259_01060 [Cytophagales bacterium]|nr:hypothetical protein [Cytophaga sp.]
MKIYKLCIVLISYLVLSATCNAQITPTEYFKRYTVNGLSINAGFSFLGETNGYKFSHHGNILERRFIYYGDYSSENWDWNIKVQYRFKNKYAFEGGFIKSQINFNFADKAFEPTLSDTNYIGEFAFGQNYVAPTLAGYYYYSFTKASEYLMNVYFAGGVNFNVNTNYVSTLYAPYYTTSASQYDPATNQHLDFNIHAKSFFMQYYIESGISFCLFRCNLYFGGKYNFSQPMMNGDYKNSQNGVLNYSDHVTSPSNYLSATVRVGYILFQKYDVPKTPRLKTHKNVKGPKLKTKYIKPVY